MSVGSITNLANFINRKLLLGSEDDEDLYN